MQITEFFCYFCSPQKWINKVEYNDHMFHHIQMNDDIDTIDIPSTWVEFERRFSPIGLFDTRIVEVKNG